jgi:signal transduction histidine kinase
MIPTNDPTGIALWCNDAGTIIQISRNDSGLLNNLLVGQALDDVIDSGSYSKMQRFMGEIKAQGAAFDWEINIRDGDSLTTLHFAGVHFTPGQVLIVLGRTPSAVMTLFDDMMRMNNEQVNQLRSIIKEQTELVRERSEHDSELYNELSRLNNELANLQRELTQKNTQLERLNQLKDQFLGMAAHDLRSPLDLILTYSEFLVDETQDKLEDEHIEFLDIIRSSSFFMLKLINNLLDIYVIESGRLTIERQPVDLHELARHNVALNQVLAQKKSITLNLTCTGNLAGMWLDADKIEQVLNNLISNAVKFSQQGSQVDIQVYQAETEAVIEVQDYGEGMEESQITNLFSFLGHQSKRGTAGEKGVGLGLAIVDKIVAEHEGAVTVQSQPGQGTTFMVRLPIVENTK